MSLCNLEISEENLDLVIWDLKNDQTINSLINYYWTKIACDILKVLEKVNRWETPWLVCDKIETNKEHVIEMLLISKEMFDQYPKLNQVLDKKIIYIKIILHDLWEVLTWDKTVDQKEKKSNEEQNILDQKEKKSWIKIIKFLKNEWIDKKDINMLIKHYTDYFKNKSNPSELNDYFVKFIDKYQALNHIINHIPEFKHFEENSINKNFQTLKQRNVIFKNKWINLLENFDSIIEKSEVNESDLKKCLIKK